MQPKIAWASKSQVSAKSVPRWFIPHACCRIFRP